MTADPETIRDMAAELLTRKLIETTLTFGRIWGLDRFAQRDALGEAARRLNEPGFLDLGRDHVDRET
ncbi:MAG TPA: hypothetical protein VHT52_11645 [Stellaceae bacterium]|nr:hypothetical protein [Stellaceae bacterium]